MLHTVDSAGVRLTTIEMDSASLPLWRLDSAPRTVITAATTGDSTALSLVGPVRWLKDGSLVVADLGAYQLLVFDSTGRYQRSLGRRGAGPGEFRDIASIGDGGADTITTYDRSLRRLTIWDHASGYVRAVGLNDGGSLEAMPGDAWLWNDSLVVVLQLAITPRPAIAAGATVQRWPMRAHLTLRDTAGTVIKRSAEFDGTYSGIHESGDTRLPFANQPFVAVARDRVYFGSGADFRLSYVDLGFGLVGEIRWPSLVEALTGAQVDQVRDETLDLLSERMPRDQARERIAMNFVPEILPKTRPAIGRVMADAEGRLWVERFEAVRLGSMIQTPGAQWVILASDGHPLARFSLPAHTRLEGIRGDEVVVVQRDSLDVPSIAIYRLDRSESQRVASAIHPRRGCLRS